MNEKTGKILPLFLVSFFLATFCPPASADEVKITIIHTNDVHGHLFPGRDDLSPGEPKPIIGGSRALARFVGQTRKKRSKDGGVLLLDAGDVFHGTPEGDLTKGQAVVDFFNTLNYDAAVVGNHEFAYGIESFLAMTKRSKFAWLGANIFATKRKDWDGNVVKGIQKTIKGVKVAVLGLTTQRCSHLNKPGNTTGLEFRNVFEIVPPIVKKLHKNGYIVVIITHMGSDSDRQLASLIPEATAIIGGHDHVVVGEARTPDAPMLAQSGEYLRRVGEINLKVNRPKDGSSPQVLSSSNRVINLVPVSGPSQNSDETKIISFLKEQRFRSFDIAVAKANTALPRSSKQRGPSRIGTFVASSLRRHWKTDASFIGLGGLRGGLPAGAITLRDLYLVYPFEDPIVVLELSGKDFVKAFRNQLRGGRLNLGSSGIHFKYDVTAKTSKRVTDVYAGDKLVTKDGRYRLAVTDYTFQRLLIERRIKPLKVINTGATVFKSLINVLDVAPDPCAASGSLLGAFSAERGKRPLAQIPDPLLKAVHVKSPAKLWRSHKINVNTADEELLASLPWISREIAQAIIQTRSDSGDFSELSELLKVPGISKDELKKLDRFLKVN
ncbi:MAG: 5'-nucleotidase C-terminal domain-containing protein [Planctomycetota bacterium]|nr:5'-nucleotidase C-terminal domain-containing protein [Planctomycetota bacterium]